MPTYEFRCSNGHKFDAYQSFAQYDSNEQERCVCGELGVRQLSTPLHCHVKGMKTVGELADANYKKNKNKIDEETFKNKEERLKKIKENLPKGASISDNFGMRPKEEPLDLAKIISSDGVDKAGDGQLDKTTVNKLNEYIHKGTY